MSGWYRSRIAVSAPRHSAAYGAPVATDRRQARSLERIDRVCAVESDAKTLRIQVLAEIRQVVGFDAYVWLLTDPTTAVGCDPLADVPCLSELPALVKFKYLTEINRWTTLSAGGPSARSLGQSTAGDLSLSPVWREVLCRYGVSDVASVVFDDRFGCWAFLDLWRDRTAGPFSAEDVAFLTDLAPRITQALRRRQAATFGAPAVSQRRDLGPVVMLLDNDLNVVDQTAATQEWLEVLVPRVSDRPVIPSSVYNVAGQLLAKEDGVNAHEASSRVHLAEGFWVTLRAARLGGADATGQAAIAVTLEETSPLDRLDVFIRSFALTPRERQLMTLLATGSDTRDLARRLQLSELTIQDHLKSVFAKTGARNRNTLLSRALGARPDGPAASEPGL